MGGGASAASQGVSDERKREVIAALREIYEGGVSKNVGDAELVGLLNVALANLLSASAAVPQLNGISKTAAVKPSALPSSSTQQLKPTGLKKGSLPSASSGEGGMRGGGGAASSRPKLQRRRSYGEKETNKITTGKTNTAKVIDASAIVSSSSQAQLKPSASPTQITDSKAQSSGTTTTSDDVAADHWDSVRELPYCPLCAMAFKSVSVLERHIKYSDMHLKAVAAQSAETAKPIEVAVEVPKALPRQVEGQDYKLLYYGSKFFWRSQDNIDLSFFHHVACSIIEVVPFDVYKNAELDRLYFDLYIIHENIDADVEAKLSEMREKFKHDNKNDKFQSATFNEVHERAQLTRVALTTYILTRLQLHVVVNEGSKATGQIRFQESSQTFNEKTPLLPPEKVPKVLIPVSVTHRRNTSTEEVKQKLTELADDQAALKHAISKAETIASLVHRFASIFAAQKRLQALSVPHRRWVLAIRKVIQINAVDKVRDMLRLRDEAKIAAKTDSPSQRRKRGQSMYRKEV